MKRPTISSLWIGGALSYIELLSLKSMQDRGHPVKLYHYKPLKNVPDWLETYDANEIYPVSDETLEYYKNSLTIIANFFRYHLLAITNEIWSDCDIYFLRPLPDQDYIIVKERSKPVPFWNNSLLRLPPLSPALHDLIAFINDPTPTLPDSPYFFDIKSTKEDLETLGGNGNVPWRYLAWGSSGPRALSYFITQHKLQNKGWPVYTHQPIPENMITHLARRIPSRRQKIAINAYAIHLFGSRMRRLLIEVDNFKGNKPIPGSFLDQRLIDHGINPDDAPLISAISKKNHRELRKGKIKELSEQTMA